MLTGENFNSNDLQKSIKALPSHSLYHSLNRSAEDAVLCRSSGPRIWGMQQRSPENPLLPLLPPPVNQAGVQRTQSFAGVRGVPENPLLPLLPPQAANQ